ncbi:Dyp-type peroxidase [Actinoplanes sp. RD1]|uniref:Dyp-type peroxidase n=1 Tax=Actinoplanes sp. RD1 TaxID=3064538 RepID=UPI002741A102|nr:Dyp-type peroxidase [Actinoplanes sp. RD1]
MVVRRRTVLAGTAVAALAGCSAPSQASDEPPVVHVHQPGVVSAPEEFAVFAAFDLDTDPAGVLRRLDERITAVHRAGTATVTVAVGASLFDGRFGLADARPRLLTAMPVFPNDVLSADRCHGDLLLQIGATRAETAAAVLADLGKGLRRRWDSAGFRKENTTTAAGRPSTRNLFGFREGAGNPDPADAGLMERLVWAGDGEPSWAAGGTYAVVRLIRFAVGLWNRDSPARQEEIIGRHRADGAPLAGGGEDAQFDYAADPDGALTSVDAHIRRANPRTPGSEQHRILRRSYSYRRSEADQGLIFVCFQRDPELGFAAAQRRLAGEALDHYVLPFGGGYWFVPPAVTALATVIPG